MKIKMTEANICRNCLIGMVIIIIISIFSDRCRAQSVVACDSAVVDSVLYAGNQTGSYDIEAHCICGEHEWEYENLHTEGLRICRHCLRWERFHTVYYAVILRNYYYDCLRDMDME